eukprot:9601817-Lingulodinium_polyedra.AAC.1
MPCATLRGNALRFCRARHCLAMCGTRCMATRYAATLLGMGVRSYIARRCIAWSLTARRCTALRSITRQSA